MPWHDTVPRIDSAAALVRVAAVGSPDERISRFAARRASARTRAKGRAMTLLHRWADRALARIHASPREASRTHAAIERAARVSGVRPLADASAVVAVTVPLAALREACPRERLPWSP